jgi:hypothetical protein
MANAVEKVNTIAIADIEAINTITDANLQALNTLEFTGSLTLVEAHTLISSQDAGGATSVTFSSLGSYDVLLFDWINFDPTGGSDDVLTFQVTTSSYSYNAPITSTFFRGYHNEADSTANLAYYTSGDQEQGTGYNWLGTYVDQDVADSAGSGNLTIFGHSSDTYVKHFMSRSSTEAGAAAYDAHVAGYVNTAEAVTAVQFKALAGGTFTGTIKLYGLATS